VAAIAPTIGLACPLPATETERIQLGHGSGGRMSAALLRDHLLPHLANDVLARLGDAALVDVAGQSLAVTTDTFVVSPLEFPGGDIGSLAVHGTCNDLAMMGARPLFLTVGLVLEEGLETRVLDRVMASLGAAAREAGVTVVAGDTKVVERGKADGIFINTSGIGLCAAEFRPAPDRVRAGDVVIVSGPIGRHGMAIMAAREGLGLQTTITSDSANLYPLVRGLQDSCGAHLAALRDPTRGGVASALNEIAAASGVGILLDEESIPVPEAVRAACEMLGLDPLYVANEGVLLAFVCEAEADAAVRALRREAVGGGAVRIGRAVAAHPGLVALRTAIGGTRVVDMLPGDQLPRIC
jgi:hydrogenase expression/formation protein HypE